MISFATTEEQESARAAMRGFATDAMRPQARDYDEAAAIPEYVPRPGLGAGPHRHAARRKPSAATAPRARAVTNAIILEELACGDATLAVAATAPSVLRLRGRRSGHRRAARRLSAGAVRRPLCGRVAGDLRADSGIRPLRPAHHGGAQRHGLRARTARSASCRSPTAPATSSSSAATATRLDAFIVAARRRRPDHLRGGKEPRPEGTVDGDAELRRRACGGARPPRRTRRRRRTTPAQSLPRRHWRRC